MTSKTVGDEKPMAATPIATITIEGIGAMLALLQDQSYRVVGPTLRDQAIVHDDIEENLASFIGGFLDLPDGDLRHRCEQTVRNYDPCISCSTHFLRFDMDRG